MICPCLASPQSPPDWRKVDRLVMLATKVCAYGHHRFCGAKAPSPLTPDGWLKTDSYSLGLRHLFHVYQVVSKTLCAALNMPKK